MLAQPIVSGDIWSPESALDAWNRVKDVREAQMMSMHEGFFIARFTTNIVADQALYNLPDPNARVRSCTSG